MVYKCCVPRSREESYRKLSHHLPPLLQEEKESSSFNTSSASSSSSSSSSSSFVAYSGTRLHLLRESVPHIPCKVREYDAGEAGRCVAVRATLGASTWITFVGDSNQRQKVHSFLDFLPQDLTYSYFLGDKQVSQHNFTLSVMFHEHRPPTFDIIGRRTHNHDPSPTTTTTNTTTTERHDTFSVKITEGNTAPFPRHSSENTTGSIDFLYSKKPLLETDLEGMTYDLRVTLVWAPLGSRISGLTYGDGQNVTKLHDLEEAKVVPDVVVVGFGTWPMLLRQDDDELVPFSELDLLARPLIGTLTALAARTTVVFWTQSRYRGFNYENDRQPSLLPWAENLKESWSLLLYYSQVEEGRNLADRWLWGLLRRTGAWLWDSTLPFNLANLEECRQLRGAGHYFHPAYHSRWWNCHDVHHASYETNSVEIQMLLNLLCNAHLAAPQHYCCSQFPQR